ncbi:MAG: shikimate kinase [Actinomycetia bacterium]|nr:shikimate kinase [Actinomycetes bacterium]
MTPGGRHLVLVGLMGAGKTTVGNRSAQQLDRAFVDTDDIVEALAGMRVAELFAIAGGEAKFRDFEHQAVADACASPAPLVISTGGGAVVDAENRNRLAAAGFVVWLRAPVDVLATRLADDSDRPLLAGDAPASLSRLLALREHIYEAVADVAIDTQERSVDDVVTAVVDAYCGVTQ